MKRASFTFIPFSNKQKQLLTWWCHDKMSQYDGIISDGSVRSGKTLIMSLSYVLWAMNNYEFETFGMAGKTIASFRRNVLFKLKLMLKSRGYIVEDKRSDNYMVVFDKKTGIENYFYIFGGKDEASQDLVQGLTCAGFFFDEVALMPESFVNQAVARCSVDGSKLWFNCNAEGPFHWFKLNWIDQLKEKNLIRVKCTLDDNPSLNESVKERYRRMFNGVFYDRFIRGLWVLAEGIIYSMFDKNMIIDKVPDVVKITQKWVGIDYGQSNATVFLLCGLGSDSKLYVLDEYYHCGKDSKVQKSPLTYAKDFREWLIKVGVNGMPVRASKIMIDPSAKGFMLQLYEEGVHGIRQADNEVLRGISLVSSIISNDSFRVLRKCKYTVEELASYRWDEKRQQKGEDVPLKDHDHCLDALRYIVNGTRMLWQKHVVNK